jgi:hypothetical protein
MVCAYSIVVVFATFARVLAIAIDFDVPARPLALEEVACEDDRMCG